MSNLVVFTAPTLDEVVQAPRGPTRTWCWDRDAIFVDGGPLATLRPLDTKPATTGVLAATYQPTRTNDRHKHPDSEPEHARSGSG